MSIENRRYKVHGTILNANGAGLREAEVILSWQRIRTRINIASAFSIEDGRYLIEYDLPRDAPEAVLLIVEARSPHLDGKLESSPLRFQRDLQVDLSEQPRDPSEFGTLLHTIEPFLDSLPLTSVEESDKQKDITFLTQETNLSGEQIMRLVVSARLEATFSITAQAWYAFLRQHIPASLPSPLLQPGQDFSLVGSMVQNIGSLVTALTTDNQTQVLQSAVSQQYISETLTAQIPAVVKQLQALHTANLLNSAYLSESTTLGQLLSLSALPANQQTAFAQALIDNIQPMEQFWQTLAAGQSGFTPAQVASLQQVFQIGSYVGNQIAVLQTLLTELKRVPGSSTSDLAKLSKADWLNIVMQSGANAVPPDVVDTATETAQQVFAEEIYGRVTSAYPTVTLASRIPNAAYIPQAQRAPLTTFFANNSQIDLVNVNLDVYVNQQGTKAFSGIDAGLQPTVLASLKSFQRVLRLTPQIDTAETLLNLGLDSAARITVLGKTQFTTTATAAGLSLVDAQLIFCIAQQRYASVLSLFTQFNTGFAGVWPGVLGDLDHRPRQQAAAVSPSLTTLFGSQDFCAVDQCTSVLGAAAYVTDLLLWLSNRKPANAYTVLLGRRPDLGNLLLNCPNTNTELPYIDLVNELLEDAVSPPAAPVSKQTPISATTAQLQAAPMYVNQAAYVKLAAASYPQTLPYDTSLDELRTYLQQSSVALWQLRLALQPLRGVAPLAQAVSTAAERFQIDSWNLQLITTSNEGQLATAWNTANPVNDLGPVSVFLQAAGITYEQLNELLDVAWIYGGGVVSTIKGVNDSCDTTTQTVAPLDAGRLDAMHRFLRLWRSTGWQMWELDLLLSAPLVGAGTLDQQAVVNLFTFRQLLDATRLSVDQVLAFFQDIDVASHRAPDGTQTTPLYAQIFLTPAVPPDQDLTSLSTIPPPALADPSLSDHIDSIRAALQISASDATTLFALTDGSLSLDNLSLLYRLVTLSAALRVSITDMLSLLALNGLTVAQVFAAPSATLGFIKTATAIQKAGFTVAMLTYILSLAPTTFGLTDAQIVSNLTSVQSAIQKIQDDVFGTVNPPATVLQTELAQLPAFSDATLLANTSAMVNGSFAGTAADSAEVTTALGLFMTPAAKNGAVYLPLNSNPADPQARQVEISTRASAILAPLAVYLTQTQVTAAVAGSLQMATGVAALLMQLVTPGTTLSLLAVLTDPALIAPGRVPYANAISSATFPNQYLAIQLLSKIGTVVNTLHLVSPDLSWLLSNAAVYGGLDLTQLPVEATQPSIPVSSFLQTVLVVQLNRAFTTIANSTATPPPPIQNLYQLISSVQSGTLVAEPDIQSTLALITGWVQADIAALSTKLGVSLLPSNDYLNPTTYDTLRTLIAMVTATSGTGAQLISWAVAAPDDSAAQSAQQALKSRFTSDAWLQAAPAMMNPIRENRSAALAAYLLAQRDGSGMYIWGTTFNDLFNYFLIDVQMSSCMLTSRIVQAYLAVQLFAQRCLMNVEKGISIDLDTDDGWNQWTWMQRFQLWVANREVFLYPENWMIETERPNSTELFQQLAQQVHQQENTAANFQNILLDYMSALDGIAHLIVTGTCVDTATSTTWVVARTADDPPTYYVRSYANSVWTGWQQIQVNVQAHQLVPAMYRRNLYLFWPQIKVSNEPQQQVPAAQATSSRSPAPAASKYVEITLGFSAMRNGSFGPAQSAKGKLYDIPLFDPTVAGNSTAVESFYTLKAQTSGSYLWLDVFRLGPTLLARVAAVTEATNIEVETIAQIATEDKGDKNAIKTDDQNAINAYVAVVQAISATAPYPSASQIGRAVFDGKFEDLELRNLPVLVNGAADTLLTHAQQSYGADAQVLLPLTSVDADLSAEPNLVPQSGALVTGPRGPSGAATLPLKFDVASVLQQNSGPLLQTAQVPFRVVGPVDDLNFEPTSNFFYGDNRRSYFVESELLYPSGKAWVTTKPAGRRVSPFEVQYSFHRFYHPYTNLFWHELSANGVAGFYNRNVQVSPDTVDSSGADVFSFSGTYNPVVGRVTWGENNEIVDFSTTAAYGIYNWELFFHIPLYLGQLLSQNQQFEDAMTWYNYIFNPTSPSTQPVPQRYWIPKPLYDLTSAEIQAQNINVLLELVNEGNANAVAQVNLWRANPYDPFLIADQRPVAYMKNVVMCYVDNLIAWADNLFSTESREALNQATLLYVLASEILGAQPQAVTPPASVDKSFLQLKPELDAFANALIGVENLVPVAYQPICVGIQPQLPPPETFYFKIPSNDKLLGYWTTLNDRLFKLRHCQNLQGGALDLPLFDAPIDPGLLVAAEAAGVDLNSVLSDVSAPLPNYRFTVLYAQAMDFCNAVRAYGAQLLTALEKSDADNLALLLATSQQQLLEDANQSFEWKVKQAQSQIDALTEGLNLANAKADFYNAQPYMNAAENVAAILNIESAIYQAVVAAGKTTAAAISVTPAIIGGAAGFGGSPVFLGMETFTEIPAKTADATKAIQSIIDNLAKLATTKATYDHRSDMWAENAAEAQIQAKQATAQIQGANLALQTVQLDQQNHQTSIANLQKQIDFLQSRFSNQGLYDWMVSQLSATYFQSYQLAYAMAKRAERCYQYELGLLDSSFISFGYWDSLKKGLLSGESLNHDLRRMQASYLDLNVRRFEVSRFISLSAINPLALITLLQTGACDFDLSENLFDGDYPGHYQRRIQRVSVTVVYPNPGVHDNVKCTLTLLKNSVRLTTDLSQGYAQMQAPQTDPRFTTQFGAIQSIVTGNAQDDPGLFITAIASNIVDQRYLPFEGAGCISSWHLEMPAQTNDIDLTTVGDVFLHLHYTALDGGAQFKQAAQQAWIAPAKGIKLLSALNDFAAPPPSAFAPAAAQQAPATPWQTFITATTPPTDQLLVLKLTPSKFPNWTRGKTITITDLTVYVISWLGGNWVLEPQGAPFAAGDINLLPMPAAPIIASADVAVPPGTGIGTWTFKLRSSVAADFQSLKSTQIGDVVLMVSFTAN